MKANVFLLLNLALAFYNMGTIWAHEVDIFRSWRLVGADEFHRVQQVHFRKIPYWIFAPVGLALVGSIALLWFHPAGSPMPLAWSIVGCQVGSGVLTGLFWGKWQAKLAQDTRGPGSPYLTKILKTHWLRTALITAYAMLILMWVCKQYGACAMGR